MHKFVVCCGGGFTTFVYAISLFPQRSNLNLFFFMDNTFITFHAIAPLMKVVMLFHTILIYDYILGIFFFSF